MKCLILAGGRGERLWPLSRKNYPKQFIEINNRHSIFQETVARNIPYCDEFIIVTNFEYRYIIDNQMKAFQGTPYRCIFEETPRKTTAAIMLACLDLQPSEFVFVVAADHLVDTKYETQGGKLSYKDAILQAKAYARNSSIVLFGQAESMLDNRFGYINTIQEDGCIGSFFEKPEAPIMQVLQRSDNVYRNLGMMVFQNGTLQNELIRLAPSVAKQCRTAYAKRSIIGSSCYYSTDVLSIIDPVAIEVCLLEKTHKVRAISIGFDWRDVGSLEDLCYTDMPLEGVSVRNDCSNTTVINTSSKQAVVVNDVNDVLIVNTSDAIYIGKQGKSPELKNILHSHRELEPFSDKSTMFYRSWGSYEQYIEEPDYRVHKITLLPGKTIYEHKHLHRSENWTIIRGSVLITINGESRKYGPRANIDVPVGTLHQISNIGDTPALILETAIGEIHSAMDMVSNTVADISESRLGFKIEPMIKLTPAYKDYLWGGTRLRDIYRKDCDYDIIAESWELSAHPDGQSIVASGKHRGQKFGTYLDTVGKEVLGWKCDSLQSFPLLVKFIDARDNLSVQVHPHDDYALEHENQYGKNEMWYVIDAEPGSGLYVGFNRDVSKDEVIRRIKDNSIMDVLNFYPTKPGDVFFIPTGTVHAIGAGNLICEIQQSSNCTYRLYDFDRRDKFGNPRELHLEKALEIIDYKKYEPNNFTTSENTTGQILSQCKYFESVIHEIDGSEKIKLHNDRFSSLICLSGSGTLAIEDYELQVGAGDSFFIPAADELLTITGSLSVIHSYI